MQPQSLESHLLILLLKISTAEEFLISIGIMLQTFDAKCFNETGFYATRASVMKDERVNALVLSCIHWDIFFDYDKIIDLYASKHQRRMFLINPLSETFEAFPNF